MCGHILHGWPLREGGRKLNARASRMAT
jgi:hypothetical protein